MARVIQRFSKTGFTRNRPRKGRSKKLSPCAVPQVQKLASKNRCMSAASIALEVAEVEGQLVSAQTICHTATSRFAWPSSQKEASSEAGSQKSTGELRFIEGNMDSNMYCDILKQKMMPSLQKLC